MRCVPVGRNVRAYGMDAVCDGLCGVTRASCEDVDILGGEEGLRWESLFS